jgi:hypothetical protein
MNKVIEINAERGIESVWADTKKAFYALPCDKVPLKGNP